MLGLCWQTNWGNTLSSSLPNYLSSFIQYILVIHLYIFYKPVLSCHFSSIVTFFPLNSVQLQTSILLILLNSNSLIPIEFHRLGKIHFMMRLPCISHHFVREGQNGEYVCSVHYHYLIAHRELSQLQSTPNFCKLVETIYSISECNDSIRPSICDLNYYLCNYST